MEIMWSSELVKLHSGSLSISWCGHENGGLAAGDKGQEHSPLHTIAQVVQLAKMPC